ncbi:hypothetical protein COY13_00200 [Candidatus Roizmanbacteria bacterium CG_4_10_14_0_2_um_filter_36_35]|uniref:NYN domain-containing protein n=4 Tax=Candidatus Roizmaniibacteriota TaxID=1752723 RepID=A0A2M7BW70_9BACT|nr:MAG: hypothetical protein COV86_02320 [Candidatus Roizmanbacteria bacterium CG11_big_fil_rev_8_21_14_0_20_35_14]PIV10765.1 MAG: hypothetical protein COS50_03780 [Candidatus Roizmanbacteria bacterium CG03_land_8_20_14_0_80_35_26]PIZ68911.1 MAG: hypothetical protein COY13_00200 [Candidatus Roizmanbacteria bacterium CG_4_10_14_0_2_um_filter_36_35]PJC33469.1 MAG: hypothetical protein CO049_00500 [Candidatus Roizmanbacteria bacterium CG_4_9_14_0_2_um_filter_36_12]PJC79830.1 MAG: hypothetical prot
MKKLKAKVYIDGANIFYTQRNIGWSIDWKNAIKFLKEKFDVLEIRYYTGIKNNDQKMNKYLSFLRQLKIKTITKPLKIINDHSGRLIYKSNCDVEMVVDIILDIDSFDILILFSGDSDFVYLIKVLQKSYQKKVFVFSSRKTISWEIKMAVNSYWFLEDFKKELERVKKNPRLRRGTVKHK